MAGYSSDEIKTKRSKKDEAAFQALVASMIDDAVTFGKGEIREQRSKATDYYHGRLPDVDDAEAEADSSKVVLSEVRDTVLAMMPSLMRFFVGSDSPVNYTPMAPQYEERARLATRVANKLVLGKDNPGFTIMWDWFMDALVRKNGFVKTWYETIKVPEYSTVKDIDEAGLSAFTDDPEVKIIGQRKHEAIIEGEMIELWDLKLRRTTEKSRIRVAALPCEETIVASRTATYDTRRCALIGHRTSKPAHELVAMGVSMKTLREYGTLSSEDEDNEEKTARRFDDTSGEDGQTDELLRLVTYSEVIVEVDYDDDEIAERRKICCIGDSSHIIYNEPIDYMPISMLCPYPEPFTFYGLSVFDMVGDIQRINSRIARDMLNSLAQAVDPIMGAVDGQVNLDDLMNPDVSKIVRMRQPGMVQPITLPFVGQQAIPVMEYMKTIREGRTGISDASQGLDPKVLQSTDNDAVMATLTNGQARVELIARIFAETGVKHLFENILHLMMKHPDKRTELLDGKWETIDPSEWDIGFGVEVDMPLGRGTARDQMGMLQGIIGQQEKFLTVLGPSNPMTSVDKLTEALRRATVLAGFSNPDAFWFNPAAMPPEEKAKLEGDAMQKLQGDRQGGAQAGPAAPDPAVEKMKVDAMLQKEAMIDAREREFKMAELQADMQKNQADNEAKIVIAQINAQTTSQSDATKAMVEQFKTEQNNRTKIIVEQIKPRGGGDKASGASKN